MGMVPTYLLGSQTIRYAGESLAPDLTANSYFLLPSICISTIYLEPPGTSFAILYHGVNYS